MSTPLSLAVLFDEQVLLVPPVVRSNQRPLLRLLCSIKVDPAKVGKDQWRLAFGERNLKTSPVLQHLLM